MFISPPPSTSTSNGQKIDDKTDQKNDENYFKDKTQATGYSVDAEHWKKEKQNKDKE